MRARISKNNQTLDGIYPARLITAIPRTILRMSAVGAQIDLLDLEIYSYRGLTSQHI
jgi:hypothetical protein